ncbi:hypothetical protein [Ilumatobacter sp.]|uniref:hypothetical protein n=1 Tax=Ilumatobacter sp. TaxID=1967498 RepID=UPI003C36C12A
MSDQPTDVIDPGEPPVNAPAEASAPRSRVPVVLVVVATVLAVLATFTTWVRVQMLDTDDWVRTSDQLLAEPEIQDALATFLTNQLFERVDVKSELTDILPDELSGLAGPLAGALRGPTESTIDQIVASDQFAALWETANRTAHEAFVAILRDEARDGISTANGNVTLDLKPLVASVGERVGLSGNLLDQLPDDAGTIQIFDSRQLADAQLAVQVLDFMSWFLFIVVVGLYALAVFLAHGRRRQAIQSVGIGLVAGGVTVLLLRGIGIRVGVGQVVNDRSKETIGELVGDVATTMLRETGWTGIVYGTVFILFAWLIGPYRWAVAVRRSVGRVGDSTGVVIVASILALLLLFWWNPGRLFDGWIQTLVLIALVVGAVVAFFRQVTLDRTSSETATEPHT